MPCFIVFIANNNHIETALPQSAKFYGHNKKHNPKNIDEDNVINKI